MNTVVCPINGLPSEAYCRKGGANYFIEPSSGIIFQAPMPSVAEMNRYAEKEYASGVYREYAKSRGLKLVTARSRLNRIKQIATGKRVLDVGCATGFFLEAAAEQGFDVTGVEFSANAISLARPDIRDRIICGDVNALRSQTNDRFDIVTAFDIIEHVQEPRSFLEDICKILLPGGLVALTSPDTDHWLRYVMGSKWPMLQPMQHTVLFSKAGIASLFELCGYRVIEIAATKKVMTLDYLANQIAVTNPLLNEIYRRMRWLLPGPLRDRAFEWNIGEFIAFAQKPG